MGLSIHWTLSTQRELSDAVVKELAARTRAFAKKIGCEKAIGPKRGGPDEIKRPACGCNGGCAEGFARQRSEGSAGGDFQRRAFRAIGGGRPRGVVAADFNGDGKLDVATAISGGWFETNRVNVLFGLGDGTFAAPVSYGVGMAPAWIASGDFNGDGRPDLVTVNAGPGSSGTTASVLLNQGNGTFLSATNYAVGGYPGFVLVADFNHDNKPDLVAANRASASLSVLLGKGDGSFNAASNIVVAAGASQLVATPILTWSCWAKVTVPAQ